MCIGGGGGGDKDVLVRVKGGCWGVGRNCHLRKSKDVIERGNIEI